MSGIYWIALNSRLQQGIALINNLTNKKFQALLSHIINTTTDELFTDSETQKLQDTLKLNETQLQLLLQSIAHIYKQSSKVVLKPTDLQRQLVEVLSFQPEKAEIFTKEWSSEVKKELGDFENHRNLTNISWELNLQSACDIGSKLAIPSARIQLDLTKIDNSNQVEKTILELGEDDLHQLFSSLEVIQLKLDNISKK